MSVTKSTKVNLVPCSRNTATSLMSTGLPGPVKYSLHLTCVSLYSRREFKNIKTPIPPKLSEKSTSISGRSMFSYIVPLRNHSTLVTTCCGDLLMHKNDKFWPTALVGLEGSKKNKPEEREREQHCGPWSKHYFLAVSTAPAPVPMKRTGKNLENFREKKNLHRAGFELEHTSMQAELPTHYTNPPNLPFLLIYTDNNKLL